MSDNSKIEWTETTWNVVTGCTRVSEGCDHCYIERTPPFRMAGRRFDRPGVGGTTGVILHPDRLGVPLGWRKPRRVFVNSLADLFHDQVPDEYIARVFTTMALSPQHTFQILTKRPARARALLDSRVFRELVISGGSPVPEALRRANAQLADRWQAERWWPLPNVWLGTSVENQKFAELRIHHLLDTPAAVRFLSCEPLLGPIDLTAAVWMMGSHRGHGLTASYVHAMGCCRRFHGIDWVIAGGESGPGARPMHPDWARSLRDQCAGAGVPFFFKQWGVHAPYEEGQSTEAGLHGPLALVDPSGRTHSPTLGALAPAGSVPMARYGKHRAGRLLDGRTWDEFPAEPQAVSA